MLQTLRNAPPGRQLFALGIVAALICAILAAGWYAFIRTSYEPLFRDLVQTDASAIVAELDKAGIPYRLADGGKTILVPAGATDSTRLHIAGQDLPLQGTVGFELFNSSSIGLTEFAQRINLQRALQGELARTIMRIDGVEAARVHLSLGEQTAFRGDRRPPRASVAVRTRPGHNLNRTTVRGIQRLVAGSVPDLDLASVAVLNDRGAVVSGEAPADMAARPGSEEERSVARFFEARIRRAVEARYPAEAIEVSVWAAVGANAEPPQAPVPGDANPAAGRDFRLRSTVAIASPMTGSAREQVDAAVKSAIGFDAGLGDSVTVTAAPPLDAADEWSETTGEPGATAGRLRASAAASAQPSLLGALQTPILLLVLIGIVLILLRRRGGRNEGPMSEQERLTYVANLRALLAQRSMDDAPQS